MAYDAVDVAVVVFSICSLLTCPIYMILICLLLRERKSAFKSSFFRYFSVLGMMDVTAALTNFFGVSLPGWGITLPVVEVYGIYYAKLYLFLAWFSRANQGTSSVLIGLNRAYALTCPMQFAQREHESWSHVFQFVPGLIMGATAAFFKDGYQYFPQRSLRRATPKIEDDNGRDWLYRAAAVIEVLQVSAIVVSYIISSFKLLSRKVIPGKKSQATNSPEKSATALGICICTLELVYFAYMVFTQVGQVPSYQYFSIHSIITDFYSVINCYLILAFSPSVRKKMWYSLTCSRSLAVASLQRKKSVFSSRLE